MLNITCEYPDAAKINLVKDCETAKQKLDRPARLRTILHIKLLVKDPLFCPGNDLISEWSTAVIQDHDVATPALLCHKEPAHGTKSPLLGPFLAFCWFFMA